MSVLCAPVAAPNGEAWLLPSEIAPSTYTIPIAGLLDFDLVVSPRRSAHSLNMPKGDVKSSLGGSFLPYFLLKTTSLPYFDFIISSKSWRCSMASTSPAALAFSAEYGPLSIHSFTLDGSTPRP